MRTRTRTRTLLSILRTLSIALVVLLCAVSAWAQGHTYPGLDTQNIFTNLNQFVSGIQVGPTTVASAPASATGTLIFMSDGTPSSVPCVGGGTGSYAFRVGGIWSCNLAVIGATSGYGVDASAFTGADSCLKLQAAIYSLPSTGGIVNATNITSFAACSVNPFQAPLQSSPLNFAGLPVSGYLLLPDVAIVEDLPFYVPNKWTVLGVGGYGTNRTTVQPSPAFRTNRTQISAVGGASGCSATGTTTVTISGTTITTPANLIGMFLLCSSNASATAVPTPKNAQIDGVITNVTGIGPYTLTLAGAGAAGTVTNTGWVISPVIMGWSPTSVVFGSNINQVTAYCTTPVSLNVTGCIGMLDMTGNESATLTNFSAINYDYMGMAVYSAQSQNGGLFGPLTFNSSSTGNNNTIAVEVGGTGPNASGGGGSGLCAVGNACQGVANRGFFGVTITGSGTGAGDGGIGFDINAANIKVNDSHCESIKTCALVGDSAPAQNVEINSLTGCSNAGCALTSVVDISSTYATGSSPAPTQNITLRNIQRSFSTTWDVRDFISLTGVISDPTLAVYTLGSSGASGRMVFTSAQQMPCITTLGVVDTVGKNCIPNTQLQLVSKLNGVYYADSWNNNGAADVCVQMNNALQWIAQTAGITSGVILDATGFNRNSGYPCATNPLAGTLGTTIPAGGVLRLGLAKFFLSVPWIIPANWIVSGSGGNGLGAGGAAGTLLSPNISNTANANYANTTTAGTVTTTAGSYTITGSGTGWTSALIGQYFMACATLPCTNQALMTGGIITAVGSTTSMTLDVPAQASVVAGGNYTVTPPLVQNSGIIRDVSIDCNSYGTGGGNGNGGCVGVYQIAGAGGGSYLDNVSIGHVNATGIDASGLNNLKLHNVTVTGNALASSVFTCLTAPQGVNLDTLVCQSGTTPTPTLSYGVMASGSGFKMEAMTFQNVIKGVELAVNPNFSTNNVTLQNVASGSGASAVTTLVDLGGVSSGGNGPNFQADLFGLQCPSGCTNAVVDALDSYTLTDAVLGWYQISRANAQGTRNILTDSITSGIPNVQIGSLKLPAPSKVLTGQTANITTTTIVTNGTAASMWQVTASLTCTAASAAATVTITIGWTDTSNTAQTFTSSTANCNALGASSYQTVTLNLGVRQSTNITYSTTIANTPTYDVRVTAGQLTAN